MQDRDVCLIRLARDVDLRALAGRALREAAAIGIPGGLEPFAAVQEVDDAGGGRLQARRTTEIVLGSEWREVGGVAGLGARVHLDDQRLLLAREGAQPLDEPREDAVGVRGRSV